MIVHVDMDAFFVAVEELLNPALRGKPVAVGGRPEQRGVVTSASYEARKFGVRSAMPSYHAKKLCPQLIFVSSHYQEYARYSEALARILDCYSPEVKWVSIDEAYLNLYGAERLYGSAATAAEKIRSEIYDQLHLYASIGVASNRLMAKVASNFAKPNGMLIILPGYEENFLRKLPIGDLPGIGEKTEKELREMGISTVGELAAMPRELLEAVFGVHGLQLWNHARGIDLPFDSGKPAEQKSISRETTLQEDTIDQQSLGAILHTLVEKATNELRKLGYRTKTVTVKFRYTDLKRINRSITLERATNLDEEIFRKAMDLFVENWQRRVRIRSIGIHLSQFEPETGQLELFPKAQEIKARALYEKLDLLRERFGFESVHAGMSIDRLKVQG